MRWIVVSCVVGCGGGSFCERQVDFAEECGQTVGDAEVEECETLLEDCNGKDQKILSDYIDCLEDEGVLTCEPEDEVDDDDAFLACVGEISGLSTACIDSFTSFDDDRSATASAPDPAP